MGAGFTVVLMVGLVKGFDVTLVAGLVGVGVVELDVDCFGTLRTGVGGAAGGLGIVTLMDFFN